MATDYKRMRQLVGSTADWSLNDLIIGDGEIAFEREGNVIKAKLGDGTQTFTQLPYYAGNDLWNKTGNYVHLETDGPVVIGSTVGVDRFTVRGGDYTVGVYREAIPTNTQITGTYAIGGLQQGNDPVTGAFMRAEAVGDWSLTNHGTLIRFGTTAQDTASPTGVGYIADDGGIVWGGAVGGSQGYGTINCTGIFNSGTPVVLVTQQQWDDINTLVNTLKAQAIIAGWTV